MINSITLLEKITIAPPRAKIYSRLGFRKKTSLTSSQKQETDRHIEDAAALISLQGSFLILPLTGHDGRTIRLAGGLSFESEKLAAFLGQCREAALMGATAGSAIMDAIREKTSAGNLTTAVVYDATASEMADAALDWMMAYINRQLRREGKQLLPRRFSAGYSDFALTNQKALHQILQLEKFGVTLTPNFLLIPEKSVTAVTGIP
ncbi:MAG: methionine synthase [Deltaproteobacteria bacterium]